MRCASRTSMKSAVPSGDADSLFHVQPPEDIYCERVYSPWMDLDPIMREKNIPLFTLETQEPVKHFDFLGITLQYEMCYTNVLQILELSQIPLHASQRGEEDPSSSVEAPAPTIQSLWRNFSTCFISEKGDGLFSADGLL